MKVKIVTDSTSDIPAPVAAALDITVVPAYSRFGEQSYRDGIDISKDAFYQRLRTDPVHPNSSQPSPQDFISSYRSLEAPDGILSIHISSRLSGTCNSALIAAGSLLPEGCKIQVVDSLSVTMGHGLMVIEAARLAQAGMGLAELTEKTKAMVPHIHFLGFFDTLEYLARGGRIGKAKALMGSLLTVKPLLTMKDGELVPIGQVRSRGKAIDRLYEFVSRTNNIQELSIIHSTTYEEARALAERLGGIVPAEKIIIAQLGAALGVHGGPGILFAAVRTGAVPA